MASKNSQKRSNSRSNRKNRNTKSKNVRNKNSTVSDNVFLVIMFGICAFLELSCFGFGKTAGNICAGILFGIFGIVTYIVPIAIFIGMAFLISNKNEYAAKVKFVAGIFMIIGLCTFAQLAAKSYDVSRGFISFYTQASQTRLTGGLIGGSAVKLGYPIIGELGMYIADFIIIIVSFIIISERSLFKDISNFLSSFFGMFRKKRRRNTRKSKSKQKRQPVASSQRKRIQPQKQAISKGSSRRKVSGVTYDTKIEPVKKSQDDKAVHEVISENDTDIFENNSTPALCDMPNENIISDSDKDVNNYGTLLTEHEIMAGMHIERATDMLADNVSQIADLQNQALLNNNSNSSVPVSKDNNNVISAPVMENKEIIEEKVPEYKFPPLSLLKKGDRNVQGDSDSHLKETAMKLQQTLQNFGVRVKITHVSCGPTVTRYELQPEQGVKVSKIINLTDDIKLNLAAADIRIEAPIPGKAAVGIEVPNKNTVAVMLRDLFESKEFKQFNPSLAFAVGKDIGGKVMVADIAKMPHLLIAGSTGSGKSVCINTIIMSILYKAHPDDVKLILIDPKVVELSIYKGIPHLINNEVVTDPKKAVGALNWAVAEMTGRYNKFAEWGVRDIAGYNKKILASANTDADNKPEKMPHILIIVDELADLMMVASGEVEDSICRLAQLARAAGIHLVIATQRPSVNVITGLIKANMPSRLAFAVSSGIDSRTILDMNGAEKLLGKGDMLFYPQGYQKPQRIQGAFVSDGEITDVVEFLIKQKQPVIYHANIEAHMSDKSSQKGGQSNDEGNHDVLFVDAGRFIIEKDKASIGMLQRMFKVGFNRAARIMDQLAEAGVVGEEEGTKPRKILMSIEQFEQFIEESI